MDKQINYTKVITNIIFSLTITMILGIMANYMLELSYEAPKSIKEFAYGLSGIVLVVLTFLYLVFTLSMIYKISIYQFEKNSNIDL